MHDQGAFHFDFTGSADIKTEYRRRVTMADPLPMTLSVVIDGREIVVLGELPNVGRGKVSMESDYGRIHVVKDSGMNVQLNGSPCGTCADLTPDDVLSIGGVDLSVTFRKTGVI